MRKSCSCSRCADENVDRQLDNFLQQHITGVRLVESGPIEVTYQLPASQVPNFSFMLSELESKLVQMGYGQYGLSDSTLEEVRRSCSRPFVFAFFP